MSSYLTPILVLTGLSFGNKWLTSGQADIEILLGGGVACGVAALIAQIPDFAPVVAGVAWLALLGYLLATPDIVDNISNLAKGKS